jgi:hypothetical protein
MLNIYYAGCPTRPKSKSRFASIDKGQFRTGDLDIAFELDHGHNIAPLSTAPTAIELNHSHKRIFYKSLRLEPDS